jgi:hypothetical protein
MDAKPDTIHVSALFKEEINASHADLFVTVRGSSVVSGNEAMKKAALENIGWKYDDETVRARGLESAIAAAKSKADSGCAAGPIR